MARESLRPDERETCAAHWGESWESNAYDGIEELRERDLPPPYSR